MSIVKENKLKILLGNWPSGQVLTSSWLRKMSISSQLTQRYTKSGWLISLGRGAYKKPNEVISWPGALASLQTQLNLNVHVGGQTALSLDGSVHYLKMGKERIFLFAPLHQKIPSWFLSFKWTEKVAWVRTSFLPVEIAISKKVQQGIPINASSPERAILECLYLSPRKFDLIECYQLIENMQTLRPEVMQNLLENCTSIKVKRLFLYMAKKANLPIVRFLEKSKIDLGKGDRAIVKGGIYIPEFGITIPTELVGYE